MTTNTSSNSGSSVISTTGTVTIGTWHGTINTVLYGGTGISSATAYSVLCGGTTSTGSMQNVSGVGTSGQVLTSNGAAALPSWQNSTADSSLVSSQTAANVASINFTNMTGFTHYRLYVRNLKPATNGATLWLRVTTDGGATWKSGVSDYSAEGIQVTNSTVTPATVTGAQLILGGNNGNLVGNNATLFIDIIDPGETQGYPTFFSKTFRLDASSLLRYTPTSGQYAHNEAINGIQILYGTGNVLTGYFSLYGIK